MKKKVFMREYVTVVRTATVVVDVRDDALMPEYDAEDAALSVMERVGYENIDNIPELKTISDFSFVDNSSDYEYEGVEDV